MVGDGVTNSVVNKHAELSAMNLKHGNVPLQLNISIGSFANVALEVQLIPFPLLSKAVFNEQVVEAQNVDAVATSKLPLDNVLIVVVVRSLALSMLTHDVPAVAAENARVRHGYVTHPLVIISPGPTYDEATAPTTKLLAFPTDCA